MKDLNNNENHKDLMFQTIISNVSDAVMTVGPDGRIRWMNPRAESLTGWEASAASGEFCRDIYKTYHRESRQRIECTVEQILRNGKVHHKVEQKLLISKDNSEYIVTDNGNPIRDDEGKVIAVLLIFRDLTAETLLKEDLKERIKELTCLYKLAEVIEKNGNSIESILSQVVELLPGSWMYVDDAVARIEFDDKSWQTGAMDKTVSCQSASITVNGKNRGSIKIGYLHHHPEKYEGPFIAEERHLIDTIAERLAHVTGRCEIEALVEQESKVMRAVADGIDEVIYISDPETFELLHVNAVFTQFWGDDWKGKKCHKVLQDRDEPCPFCTNDKIFGEYLGKSYVWEFQNEITKQWYRCSDKAIPWVDGRLVRFEIASDITELKTAFETIRQHKENLEKIVKERTSEITRKNQITTSINEIFRGALEEDTEEGVAKSALAVAEELTGARFGFIGLINSENKLDTIGLSNPGWDACDMPGTQSSMLIKNMPVRGIWGSVIKAGISRISNAPASEEDSVGIPKGHPLLTSFLGVPLKREEKTVGIIALGNKENGFTPEDQEAIEMLSASFFEVLLRKQMELALRRQAVLETGQRELSNMLLEDLNKHDACQIIINYVCKWMKSPVGLLYQADTNNVLKPVSGYAYKPVNEVQFKPGEGIVGQAALEQKPMIQTNITNYHVSVKSGLAESVPQYIHVWPIIYNNRVVAVLEVGLMEELTELQKGMLECLNDIIAVSIEGADIRERQKQLLEETQQQSEELQAQQEELNAANEELEEHNQRLKDSEEQLRAQQEELQVTNEELEEKTDLLERQKAEVEKGRLDLQKKAHQLELASKYKSEFLSNMSHELRTPLNSLLLLARSLMENKEGNLTEDQQESAQVIYSGGNDLLALINEILDLSRIESGRMELRFSKVYLVDLKDNILKGFRHLAKEKKIDLTVEVKSDVEEMIISDRQRLEQILKNLVGNAVKFTEEGSVNVTFRKPDKTLWDNDLNVSDQDFIQIQVQDDGIGIAEDKQEIVFEAFQQADGGSSRRYGGTGLGLSITRELVHLLGGEIHLTSELGKGSVFDVFIPINSQTLTRIPAESTSQASLKPKQKKSVRMRAENSQTIAVADDRDKMEKNARSILIIEDDSVFAKLLKKHCHSQNFKTLVALNGEDGVELARKYIPQGIILDLNLPGIDGWRVLELLKENQATRHIPIHLISADEPSNYALRKGAIGYAQKPVTSEDIHTAISKMEETATKQEKRVLIVEDNVDTRRGIVSLISDEHITIDEAENGADAIKALEVNHYDCMILDLGLDDIDGNTLLKNIKNNSDIDHPPVIVYTGRDLSWEENLELRSFSDSIIIKDVKSDERLLDEVALFLHRVVAEMPEQKRQVITNLHDTDALLRDKTVLLVDDDMRALFALTRLLSAREMNVLKAENGQKAIDILDSNPDIDLVLMDIMMPIMDGYETMKQIRKKDQFKQLPIIALTAKAMKEDRDKCIRAGADDYLPKPVDQDRLISMLRVWLYR